MMTITQAQVATALQDAAPYLGLIPSVGGPLSSASIGIADALNADPELFAQIGAEWSQLQPILASIDWAAAIKNLPALMVQLRAMLPRPAQPTDPAMARVSANKAGGK